MFLIYVCLININRTTTRSLPMEIFAQILHFYISLRLLLHTPCNMWLHRTNQTRSVVPGHQSERRSETAREPSTCSVQCRGHVSAGWPALCRGQPRGKTHLPARDRTTRGACQKGNHRESETSETELTASFLKETYLALDCNVLSTVQGHLTTNWESVCRGGSGEGV